MRSSSPTIPGPKFESGGRRQIQVWGQCGPSGASGAWGRCRRCQLGTLILGLLTLLTLGLIAPTATGEPQRAPTLSELQTAYPDLAGVVRAVESMPCRELESNRREQRDCTGTIYAVAEAVFTTGAIRFASDVPIPEWVALHEIAHLVCFARWADPSEACAAQVEKGRR